MCPSQPADGAPRGYIVPIGGAEEKFDDPEILSRFVELCGGKPARIAVVPTASELEDAGRKPRWIPMGASELRNARGSNAAAEECPGYAYRRNLGRCGLYAGAHDCRGL